MGKLIIRRQKEIYDFIYDYKIIIDGVMVDRISSGQSLQFEIADNRTHSIYVKQRILSSPIIDFKVENETIVDVGGFSYTKYFIVSFIGTILISLLTRHSEYRSYSAILSSFVFVLFFLVVLIRRNKCLTIREIKTT